MNIMTTPAHRIGESLVRVVDKNGNPVADKELVLNQFFSLYLSFYYLY